jgi:hypothetical protein
MSATTTPPRYTSHGYAIHPAADMLPLITLEEFEELKADIMRRGQRIPILMKGRVLLDGRHRMMVCQLLKLTPKIEQYGGNDEVGEIISRNIRRRHLTDEQRVMIAAQMRGEILSDEAQVRQKAHLRKGDQAPVVVKSSQRENGEFPVGIKTHRVREMLAAETEVSDHKARQALDVAKHAPELADKVAAGKMRLARAAKEVAATRIKKGVTKRRKPELTFAEDVTKRFMRWLDHWPVTKHHEVKEVIRNFIKEK